jgi:hypothetical protein
MMENIEKVLDRGEKLEVLVDKTESLRYQADQFQKSGKALRNKMWWQNIKMKLLVALIICIVIVVIFLFVCFSGGKNCTKGKNSSHRRMLLSLPQLAELHSSSGGGGLLGLPW